MKPILDKVVDPSAMEEARSLLVRELLHFVKSFDINNVGIFWLPYLFCITFYILVFVWSPAVSFRNIHYLHYSHFHFPILLTKSNIWLWICSGEFSTFLPQNLAIWSNRFCRWFLGLMLHFWSWFYMMFYFDK